jgi:hypothetical protein
MDYPWEEDMFPINFGAQMSSELVIKEQIRFPGSRMLPFPTRVTISHMDYPWEDDVPY